MPRRSRPAEPAQDAVRPRVRTIRSRAHQRAATEAEIRRAGMRLFMEKGFKETTTHDIARAAGVSPRTFFNYFASKSSVVQIPRAVLADTLRDALLARPPGEDPATSLAAAALTTLEAVGGAKMAATNPLFRSGVRMLAHFPQMQHRAWERRADLEQVAWTTLLERGTSPGDLAARTAVTVVISLGWQAINIWAHDTTASLPAVMQRCLSAVPPMATLTAGPATGSQTGAGDCGRLPGASNP